MEELDCIDTLNWVTLPIPSRTHFRAKWLKDKIVGKILSSLPVNYRWTWTRSLNAHLGSLKAAITDSRPDIIMAHNIDTLYPAYLSSIECSAKLIFDSMEFHSNMGDGQEESVVDRIRRIESLCLPKCSLVTTVGKHAADLLMKHYPIRNTLALRNVPRKIDSLVSNKLPGFNLYWRNSVLGLGQRGLGDAIEALASLPDEIKLHLQGRLTEEHNCAIQQLAMRLGVLGRIVIHPPFQLGKAIEEASRFSVGLCLEHSGILNHEIALSNKVFDYHMAGLAVVGSDLPAMSSLIAQSQGGIVFRAGDVSSLREAIIKLYESPELLSQLGNNARKYALENANLENEMIAFKKELLKLAGV